jgi:hypothetical protein
VVEGPSVVGSTSVVGSPVLVSSPPGFTHRFEAQTRPSSHELPVVHGQLSPPTGHSSPVLLPSLSLVVL